MTFQEKLLNLRKQAGLSQEELADKLEVSRQAVSRWEVGTVLPDAPNLKKLSALFHVSIDYLLGDEYETDQDIPTAKTALTAAQRESNRRTALAVVIGLQALALCIGLAGWFAFWSMLMVFASLILHILLITGFEVGLRRTESREPEAVSRYHRQFYRISVWLFAYSPIRILGLGFWNLYPRPYLLLGMEFSILALYLLVCLVTFFALRPRKS